MLLAELTTGTTTMGTAVSFTKTKVTNDDIIVNANGNIKLPVPGAYEITGSATITSTATGTYGLEIEANGSTIGNPGVAEATASGELATVPLYGVLLAGGSSEPGFVTVNIVPAGEAAPEIDGANITVKRFSFV